MEQKSMTALVCAFARAYHADNNKVKIFDDSVARLLLSNDEYTHICLSVAKGIGFLNPSFSGNEDEALRWIVDNQLSPSPLGRAAFAEKALETAVTIGARQYLIMGAGYDTFAYRQPHFGEKLQIFELDHPATAEDKQIRLHNAGIKIPKNIHFVEADFTEENWCKALMETTEFESGKISFCSILGLTYYLSKQAFERLTFTLSSFLSEGSSIIFDYPDESSLTDKAGERAKKQVMLAGAANEKMLASYSLLSCGKEMKPILWS